jgi:uroporphyrin-3 C-methyltransferase
MSDKEENSPEHQDTKAAYRNEKKNKTVSSTEPAFNKTDVSVTGKTDSKVSKPGSETATAIPKVEPVMDNSTEKDISPPKTPRVRYTKQPAFGGIPSGRGKFFLWLAILILGVALILVAVGGVYYTRSLAKKEQEAREALSKKLVEQFDMQIKPRVASQIEENLSGREEPLRQAITNLKDESNKNAVNLKMIQEEVAALESSLRTVRKESEKGPKTGAWDIAEAIYLLRIANERLRLEQDVNTALVALQMADQIIHKVSDPALTPVRSELTEEINSLKAVPVPDIDGMALSLNSLIGRVKELKLKEIILDKSTPNATTSKEQAPEAESNAYTGKVREFLHAIWSNLQHLVVVKHRDKKESNIPVLLPKERYFLYQNLQFELETARLSLLQKNQDGFQQSIERAKSWLQTYFQGSEAEAMENTLTELEQTAIKPSLPDISQSLKTLNGLWKQIGPQSARDYEGGRA